MHAFGLERSLRNLGLRSIEKIPHHYEFVLAFHLRT
jgi:hypothetical protein